MNTKEAKQLIADAKNIAVLTGAGMSTESGLPDFRSNEGIYNTLTTAMTFHIGLFNIYPNRFYSVIGPFYGQCVSASPNPGHLALAELEKRGKHVEIATQNVDCLHQKAGSSIVHEIHGTIDTVSCRKCKHSYKASKFAACFAAGKVPHCPACGKALKPDLTFFGEELPSKPMRLAELAFQNADLVMILGTSLRVSPANSLPLMRAQGTPMIIINHDSTPYDSVASYVSHRQIGVILPELVGIA